jgi:hypothetical protein
MTITRRTAIVLTIAIYAIVGAVLGIIVGHFNIPLYWRMLNDGRVARAVVLRTACENHGSVFYRFEVAGREYTGVGNAGFRTPDCDRLKPGDQIDVYYLTSDPDVSLPGEIRDRWDNELMSLFLVITVFPALIISGLWRHLRGRFRVVPKPGHLATGGSD